MISNVKIEVLDIFGHIDSRVAIVLTNGEVGFEGALHVFMNNDSLAAFLKAHREAQPQTLFQYVEDYLGTAVNYAIWNDFEGLSLHSSPDSQFDVAKKDLEPLTDLVDSFRVMTAVNHGKMSLAEASQHMRHKQVFFVGERPSSSLIERRNTVFGATILRLGEGERSHEAVAAFLTREGAEQQAAASGAPVSELSVVELSALWNHLYPIIVEPKRSFCIEFHVSADSNA